MKLFAFLLLATCALAVYAAPSSSAESSPISAAAAACLNAYNENQQLNNEDITLQINACLQAPLSSEQDYGAQLSCVSHILGHAKTTLGKTVEAYNKCMESVLNNSSEQQ